MIKSKMAIEAIKKGIMFEICYSKSLSGKNIFNLTQKFHMNNNKLNLTTYCNLF